MGYAPHAMLLFPRAMVAEAVVVMVVALALGRSLPVLVIDVIINSSAIPLVVINHCRRSVVIVVLGTELGRRWSCVVVISARGGVGCAV